MAQAQIKTTQTEASVDDFLAAIDNPVRRQDAETVCRLMGRISGEPPKMWGPSIVGFGRCRYRYESGREGEMGILGFSPRKTALTIYFSEGLSMHTDLLARLGRHTTSKVCLYIKRLSDVDLAVLEQLIRASYDYVLAHQDAMHRAQ